MPQQELHCCGAQVPNICTAISIFRCHRRSFTVAGLKDKSGVTEQHVTSNISPTLLMKGAATLPGVLVGDFALVSRSLRLGETLGNR